MHGSIKTIVVLFAGVLIVALGGLWLLKGGFDTDIIRRVSHSSMSGSFEATYIDPRSCTADEQKVISASGIDKQSVHSCKTDTKEIDGRQVAWMTIEYGELVDCLAGCGYGARYGAKIRGQDAVRVLPSLRNGINPDVFLPRMPSSIRDKKCTSSKTTAYQNAFSENIDTTEAILSEKVVLKYHFTQPYACEWEEKIAEIPLKDGAKLVVNRYTTRTWEGNFYRVDDSTSVLGDELKIVDNVELFYVLQKTSPKFTESSLTKDRVDEVLEADFGKREQKYTHEMLELSRKISTIEQMAPDGFVEYKQKKIVAPVGMVFDPKSLQDFHKNPDAQISLYLTGNWIRKEINKLLSINPSEAEYYAVRINIIENPQDLPLEKIIPRNVQELVAKDVHYGAGVNTKIYYEIRTIYYPDKDRYIVYLPFKGGYFEVRISGEIFSMPGDGAYIFNALISAME